MQIEVKQQNLKFCDSFVGSTPTAATKYKENLMGKFKKSTGKQKKLVYGDKWFHIDDWRIRKEKDGTWKSKEQFKKDSGRDGLKDR